jgi:hypothetical protein
VDGVDIQLADAATDLMGLYTGDFTLGGSVRNIDLLGSYGTTMRARLGYLDIGSTTYRISTISIPTVFSNTMTQVA